MAAAMEAEDVKERELMDLLAKLKEAAKVPEHAMRRVKRLDEMINGLRKAKATVIDNIEADTKRLEELTAEEASLTRTIASIKAHHDEMERERDDIRGRLGAAETGFSEFIHDTRATAQTTTRKEAMHRKTAVAEELRVQRGYSVDKDSKPHLQSPESVLFKARALLRRGPSAR